MMIFYEEVSIPHEQLEIINGYLKADSKGKFQGVDKIITNSVIFGDNAIMDIKCCGCDDAPSWAEAVLFKPYNGGYSEVCCSQPSEDYEGEWKLTYGNTTYQVNIVDGNDI